MKNIIYFIFLLSASAFSQNEKLFEEANKAYTEADYSAAVKNYEEILQNGETSAELYFNLANAFFKLEKIGSSIFYYEKALQLKPNDEDIQINLEIARKSTIDDLPDFETPGFSNIIKKATTKFGKNIFAVVAIVGALVFLILFGFYYFSVSSKRKRLFFSSAVIVSLVAFVAATFVYMQNNALKSSQFAIIFDEEASVKNEPTIRGEDIFVIHEGTKIEVTEEFQEWMEIELSDGKQGWIRKETVKKL